MSFVALANYIRALTPHSLEQLLVRGHVMRRAQQYASEKKVADIWVDGSAIRASVSGTSSSPYLVVLRLQDGEIEPQCSCPYAHGTCWHTGAVLLTLMDDPARLDQLAEAATRQIETGGAAGSSPVPSPDAAPAPPPLPGERDPDPDALRDRLFAWPKRLLVETLLEIALRDPVLRARIAEKHEEPANLDLRLFRQAARAALRPGQQLSRYEVPRVASDLAEIAGSVGRLVGGGHPEQALALLEEIAALGWERLDEADDRDGALARAVREILLEWIRGWGEVPGRDRQWLARELFGWLMEDEGRITSGLVFAARDVLGPTGLETLGGLLRPLLQARRPGAAQGDADFCADPFADRLRAVLRETAEARGDLEEFLRYCEAEGAHGADVLAAARRLAHEGQFEEALRWVERGHRRARGTARAQIEELRVVLLLRMERRREAIEAAWEMFLAEPGAVTYRRVIGSVADGDRAEWRRRALDHAEAGSDATGFVEVAVAAGDLERLTYRLEQSPAFVLSAAPATLERAAVILGSRNPHAAARIHVYLAGRVLSGGEAATYDTARDHLERARESYEADGDPFGWREALDRLREAHSIVKTWFDT